MVQYLPPVDNLELSERALAFLKLNYIYIIPDLIQRTRRELLELPGADAEVVLEIDLALRRNGKLLGARLDNWPPRPGK